MNDNLSEQNKLFLEGLAYSCTKTGVDKALELFKQCEKNFSSAPSENLYLYSAQIYEKKGDIASAKAVYKKGIKAGHDYLWIPLAYFNNKYSKNPNAFFKTLEDGVKSGSDIALHHLVDIYSKSDLEKDNKTALKYADKLIKSKTYPLPSSAVILKAQALKNLGQYEESIKVLEEMYDGDFSGAALKLCEFYLEKDSPIMDLNKAIYYASKLRNHRTLEYLAEIYTRTSSNPDRLKLAKAILNQPYKKKSRGAVENFLYLSIFDESNLKTIYGIVDYLVGNTGDDGIKLFEESLIKHYTTNDDDVNEVRNFFSNYSRYKKLNNNSK